MIAYIYRDFPFNQHFLSGFLILGSELSPGISDQVKRVDEEISNYHKAVNVIKGV